MIEDYKLGYVEEVEPVAFRKQPTAVILTDLETGDHK